MRRMTLALAIGWGAVLVSLAGSSNAAAAISHGVYRHSAGNATNALLHSSNWSGFAVTGGSYTRVRGSWKVPTVEAASGNRYAAEWVGIGGFSTADLIQAGTSEQMVGGVASYNAWTEILPAAEVALPGFTVQPGDAMTVTVTRGTGNAWTIVVKDATRSESFTKHLTYASSLASAEWIHEAPTVNGSQARLASTTNVTFTAGTVNGSVVIGSGGTQNRIQLVGPTDATPSVLSTKKDAFSVADGTTAPKKPTG